MTVDLDNEVMIGPEEIDSGNESAIVDDDPLSCRKGKSAPTHEVQEVTLEWALGLRRGLQVIENGSEHPGPSSTTPSAPLMHVREHREVCLLGPQGLFHSVTYTPLWHDRAEIDQRSFDGRARESADADEVCLGKHD